MNPAFSAGTLPLWRHPIRERTSHRGIDMLDGIYKTARSTTLAEGDAVPGYPGMIIMGLDKTDSGISREWNISAEGSLDATYPTKIIGRGKSRTLESGWDERTESHLTWNAEWLSCTATASTDVVSCTGHPFSNGQRVVFRNVTGGAGITGKSFTTHGTAYFVIDAASGTFKVSLTAGGAAVNITTDMTVGQVIHADYSLGAAHRSYPYLYLVSLTQSDDNTDWQRCELAWRGLEEDKPYRRSINGQVVSSTSKFAGYISLSDNIYENYPPTDSTLNATLAGTDLDIEYDAATISLSDTYLSSSEPPTEYIGQFWTPPDPPDVTIMSLSGEATKYFYPFGWKCVSMNAEQIPGRTMWLITANFAYQVPTMPTTLPA